MQLVEQGKVSLDSSISKYIFGVPSTHSPILVRHLLGHTSGISKSDYSCVKDLLSIPAQVYRKRATRGSVYAGTYTGIGCKCFRGPDLCYGRSYAVENGDVRWKDHQHRVPRAHDDAREMYKNKRPADSSGSSEIGLGWFVRDLTGKKISEHDSHTGRAVVNCPQEKFSLVLLSNLSIGYDMAGDKGFNVKKLARGKAAWYLQ